MDAQVRSSPQERRAQQIAQIQQTRFETEFDHEACQQYFEGSTSIAAVM